MTGLALGKPDRTGRNYYPASGDIAPRPYFPELTDRSGLAADFVELHRFAAHLRTAANCPLQLRASAVGLAAPKMLFVKQSRQYIPDR